MMKQNKKLPFEILNKGICDTCAKDKPLDSMVMKDYTKGLYECKDCKVDHEWFYHHKNYDHLLLKLDKPLTEVRNQNQKSEKTTKVKKVITWITG